MSFYGLELVTIIRAETNIRNVTFSKRTNIRIFVRLDESVLAPLISKIDWKLLI